MKLVRGAWKLLVAIKDGLVLIAMLLFFGLLFAALNARPGNKPIKDGALVLDLDGPIVEQPAEVAPFAALSGQNVTRQYRARDIIRAIDAARTDDRVKALVLDLDKFGGAYPATLNDVAAAIRRFRDTKKPVLAYALSYTDGGYRLAAAASEIWVNPMAGAVFSGPGGTQLYYKGLIDKLGVNAHVYRVGQYKSAVEPYLRADQSDAARIDAQALYGSLLENWRQDIRQSRPTARVDTFLNDPAQPVLAVGGDVARANLAAGIVDKLGDRTAFGRRVAQVAGGDANKPAGYFTSIDYDDYLAAHPLPTSGDGIGVVTIAGEIVDGEGGPGQAHGDTIADAILKGLAKKDLKALVVRIDSPGGSVFASERIRLAILEAKRQGLPIVVSMGGLAASGGYWVSTPGDIVFAEPSTITGSIGVFAVLPTFENALAKIGITTDGVRTTPLSGQPDLFGGLTPATNALLQAGVENAYRQFIARVSAGRHMPPARVDQIAQGRVWIGGAARQLGLVDRFGDLNDAMAEAARRAKLDPAKVHAVYLEKKPGWAAELAKSLRKDDDDDAAARDVFARIAIERRATLAQALGDATRLVRGGPVQARCLECGGWGPDASQASDARLLDLVLARFGLGGA